MSNTPQAPPSIFQLLARFQDIDDLGEAVEGWDLDWRQLDRGRLEAEIHQLGTPSALLSQVGFSRQFHQRGGTPPGFLTIGLLQEGGPEVQWCGRNTSSGQLLVFPSSGEYESMSPPGFGAITLSFSRGLLERRARALDLPDLSRLMHGSDQLLTCDPKALADLRRELRSIFRSAASDQAALSRESLRRQIEVEVPTLLLEALRSTTEVGRVERSSVRSRVAREALAMIAESPHEPLTVQQICAALHVSQRTLEYAFRERFDVTPKRYLQAVRLNGARRELRWAGPGGKVSDVANRWGFWHLGQFAQDYRSAFGELPSETLCGKTDRAVPSLTRLQNVSTTGEHCRGLPGTPGH